MRSNMFSLHSLVCHLCQLAFLATLLSSCAPCTKKIASRQLLRPCLATPSLFCVSFRFTVCNVYDIRQSREVSKHTALHDPRLFATSHTCLHICAPRHICQCADLPTTIVLLTSLKVGCLPFAHLLQTFSILLSTNLSSPAHVVRRLSLIPVEYEHRWPKLDHE